jgi:GNAT superfamily N-acetyltransferase
VAVLHASLALARRIDLSEIGFCALAARAGEPGGADSLLIGGGQALFAHAGSPLNKMLGLGLGQDVSDAELDAIDDFYDRRGVDAQVELCPLATPGLAARLIARGYVLQGFENELARVVDGEESLPAPLDQPGPLAVNPATSADDEELWVDVVTRGFAAAEQLAAHDAAALDAGLRRVMRAFRHESMVRYLVHADGTAVGGGGVFVFNGVAGLVGTATVPDHRGRGVQHAVVARMLRDAAPRADLAIATVAPGSQSQRTFERFGFRVIYTRAILVRSFK